VLIFFSGKNTGARNCSPAPLAGWQGPVGHSGQLLQGVIDGVYDPSHRVLLPLVVVTTSATPAISALLRHRRQAWGDRRHETRHGVLWLPGHACSRVSKSQMCQKIMFKIGK
jgi:hypothetical protein